MKQTEVFPTEVGNFSKLEINDIKRFIETVKSYRDILVDAANRSSNLEDPMDIDLIEMLYSERGIVRGYEAGIESEVSSNTDARGMRDTYRFAAVLDYADDGITVTFPDLPGCIACGYDSEEASKNATEALGLHLCGLESDGDEIPDPTAIADIELKGNQGKILVSINNMPVVRHRLNKD